MKLSFLAIIIFVASSTAGRPDVDVAGLVSFGLENSELATLQDAAPSIVAADIVAAPSLAAHKPKAKKGKKHRAKWASFQVASCAKGRTDGRPINLRYRKSYLLNETATFTFNDRLKKGVTVARKSFVNYNVRINKKLVSHNRLSLCNLVEKDGDGRCPLNNAEMSAFRWQGAIDIPAVIKAFGIVRGDRIALGASARNIHTHRLLFCVRGLLTFK